MEEAEDNVQRIIEKVQRHEELTRGEWNELSHYFTPDSPDQAKAYLALSLIFQHARNGEDKPALSVATAHLQRTVEQVISEDLAETDDVPLIRGVTFLTAVFHVDADIAAGIFTKEGTLEAIMDAVDVSPSESLELAIARLLAEAAGHKKCRTVLPPPARQWLEKRSRQSRNKQLAVACGVARVKLWQSSVTDAVGDGEDPEEQPRAGIEELTLLMKGIIVSDNSGSGIVEAVEGLAYLSTDPDIKEQLSKDRELLKHLLALIPDRKKTDKAPSVPSTAPTNAPLLYGIITIIANLIAYRPRLSEEQRQIERLKSMSKNTRGSKYTPQTESTFDDDSQVKTRVRRLIEAGILPKLSVLPSLTDSQAVHRNVARAYLSVTEDKENRGLVLQSGGSKALQSIIRQSSAPPPKSGEKTAISPAPLDAIQALAKLSITASPIQVYGADVGPIYDAVRPLSLLILDSSANQLQQFEGMMALTNLASISPDICSRIANLDGFLSKVELILFEDHVLLRRAAMELICNLVAGSDKTFERYAGSKNGSAGVPKSKLHLVLAICDVEDLPTRLAASGTLATLMSSPPVCKAVMELQIEKGRFLPIMTEMVRPISPEQGELEPQRHVGLIHRAMVCILSFLSNNEGAILKDLREKYAEQVTSLQTALADLVKQREEIPLPDPILQIVLQAAKAVATLSK
ncbi:hypothetical protein NMY22_g6317 [Coprinellus aureogranulatus]|nr:hypothetical protein NMY22_g6317 [Coprinellus aureogranulatus]